MNEILDELYFNFIHNNETYAEERKKVRAAAERLKPQLSKAQLTLLLRLEDSSDYFACVSEQNGFEHGMSLGVRLMVELLQKI